MSYTIEPACDDDLHRLVELERGLFREDASVHEPGIDVTWPDREGRADFERLLDDSSCVVLVARRGERPVGFLAGYTTAPSAIRPVTSAYLRSLIVDPAARRLGIATALVGQFVTWADDRGCAQVTVDSYAANHAAQRLYERLGFTVQSVTRIRALG